MYHVQTYNEISCIMYRKILCQLSYDTPDLISIIFFICRRLQHNPAFSTILLWNLLETSCSSFTLNIHFTGMGLQSFKFSLGNSCHASLVKKVLISALADDGSHLPRFLSSMDFRNVLGSPGSDTSVAFNATWSVLLHVLILISSSSIVIGT